MINKYRKKPINIEAVQWTGTNQTEIESFVGSFASFVPYGTACRLMIHTLEGDMLAKVWDYIIKGVDGDFYPCKKAIFEKTYEEVKQ